MEIKDKFQDPLQEQDNELIKAYFKENIDLLKSIRSLFFGLPISDKEKQLIKETFQDEKLRTAFRKNIYAKFGDEARIEKIPDFWISTDSDSIIGATKEAISQIIKSKQKTYELLEKTMLLLENPDGEVVNLDFKVEELEYDPYAIGLLARNKFMNSIVAGLNIVNIIANTKAKTKEEVIESMKKNSGK